LQKEKDDLVAGIAKLRQGISQLNKEARERLQNAFTFVNERFPDFVHTPVRRRQSASGTKSMTKIR